MCINTKNCISFECGSHDIGSDDVFACVQENHCTFRLALFKRGWVRGVEFSSSNPLAAIPAARCQTIMIADVAA